MKAIMSAALVCVLFSVISCSNATVSNSIPTPVPAAKPAGTREPVLVELFTSEGCPNCPPADAQLAFLEVQQPIQNANVITLGFHVDYFDHRGWKDENSSRAATDRQNVYAGRMNLKSIYTPQMIVDGQTEFIGSDAQRAGDVIGKAAVSAKGVVEIKFEDLVGEISIRNMPKHEAATVFLAAAEDNIVSVVKAGSNSGKTLKHISVVRGMDGVGQLQPNQSTFKTTVTMTPGPKWKKENLKYVAFVQENVTGRVIAVGQVRAK